jgi:dTDP-4-dehydrorhamnose reductase
MRILILGGDGTLGHQVLQATRASHEVHVTLHRGVSDYARYGLFDPPTSHGDIDVRSLDKLTEVFGKVRPQAVVNCIGLIKQRDEGNEAISNIEINSLFPHRIAQLCRLHGARMVHLSTDCVFSGRRGGYAERDVPDATDLYGRSKLLGEVTGEGVITLRTSFVGRELSRGLGLLEWFLAQKGRIKGYRKAIFSGLTSPELARVIRMVIEKFPEKSGLFHVAGTPIDKCSLLELFKERYKSPVEIVPDDTVVIDRSLDSSKFRKKFDYRPPSWPQMIAEL